MRSAAKGHSYFALVKPSFGLVWLAAGHLLLVSQDPHQRSRLRWTNCPLTAERNQVSKDRPNVVALIPLLEAETYCSMRWFT